jgi:hypothetical protein
MRKLGWFTALAALALAGCGGGDDSSFGSGSSGGSSSGGGPTPATLTVVSSAQSIPSDGSADATITAYVRDANNALLEGVIVTFSATSGGVAPSTATTNSSGLATTSLSTAGDSVLRTITVTATVSGLTPATVAVQVAAGGGGTTVQLGTGTGAAFQPGVIGISNPNLSAGGSTTLTVSLVQSDGTLYTQDATIVFSSNCVASGTAQIQPSATAGTNTGIATVNYVAQGCSGADVITATTTTSGGLSASGTVTVAPAAVGSIIFVSATPTNIALQGTGDASRPESSTVVFRVVDATGGPVSGATVTFALNTQVGGISLTPGTATSGATGQVQTVVSAGTVATSVKVTATVTSVTPNISTQSSQLTVTTGIPTDNSFSLAVGCFNIEGLNVDGVTTDVTARLGDRFQNPVPDGTAVTFTAEGGNILSQCTTTTNASEGGVCTVSYRSSNPRPSDGRVTLLAKAIGEESFVDTNGDGEFDSGTDTFTDLAEPFRDDNENGTYEVGEDFFDFDRSFARSPGDGLFNGVLCTGASCGPTSTGIGEQNLIILSGSNPVVDVYQGAVNVTGSSLAMGSINGSLPLVFNVRDSNGNIMPGGTTVSLSASGASLGVASPSSFSVPCATPDVDDRVSGQTDFPFSVTSGVTVGNGVVTLTVTTPRGVATVHQISVSNP